MGFIKHAAFEVIQTPLGLPSARVARAGGPLMKDAHRHEFNYEPRPGYLYVRSRAISSRCNDNFDEFPAAEIKAAYRTFVGKPVFVNHRNENHRRMRGVIVDAALHEDTNPDGSPDTWCEVLMEVDAVRFPKLAEAIIKGHIDRTSMGTDVKYSVCSACGNKASTPLEYCAHIPRLKGKLHYRTTASGQKVGEYIREICYGLGFFENSLLVEDPADPTAYAFGVDTRGLSGATALHMAHVASRGRTAASGDPLTCHSCGHTSDDPGEFIQARKPDFTPIPGMVNCRDDEACYQRMLARPLPRDLHWAMADLHADLAALERMAESVPEIISTAASQEWNHPEWTADHQRRADADNAYTIHGSHHTSQGRVLDSRVHALGAVGDDDWERHWDEPDHGAPVPDFMTKGAHEYRAKHGLLAQEHGGFSDIMADRDRAHEMSAEYDKLPHNDPRAHGAYRQLAKEVHQQFKHLTHRMGVKVEFTDDDPYANHHEMAADVANNKRLRVLRTSTTESDSGAHPQLSNRENDEFRAVHDAFGHAATGRPFDRNGEEAAWASHASMFSPKARSAMTTETRGQNSSLIMNGHFPEQKAGILPKKFWDDKAVASVRRRSAQPVHAARTAASDWHSTCQTCKEPIDWNDWLDEWLHRQRRVPASPGNIPHSLPPRDDHRAIPVEGEGHVPPSYHQSKLADRGPHDVHRIDDAIDSYMKTVPDRASGDAAPYSAEGLAEIYHPRVQQLFDLQNQGYTHAKWDWDDQAGHNRWHGVTQASRHLAYGEIMAPPEVDTLRDDICPVCFGPETMIRTDQGYAPIASIEPGDKVLSSDGQYHVVAEVMEREYDGLVYEVRAQSMAEPVLVTPEHPFLALVGQHLHGAPTAKGKDRCRPGCCARFGESHAVKRGRWGSGEITHRLEWVYARNLTEGGWVATSIPKEATDLDRIDIPAQYVAQRTSHIRNGPGGFDLTEDFLWTIGMYLSEGSTGPRSLVFSLHQKEIEYADRLIKFWSSQGYTAHLYQRHGQGCQVEVYSTTLAQWFPSWLGSGCATKALPPELLNLPEVKRSIIFEAVLDGDGHRAKDECGQTSPVLAMQLAEWAISRGVAPSIYVQRPANKLPVYTVHNLHGRARSHWEHESRLLSEIVEWREIPYAGTVYNLRVETDPTYTVQSIAVHNCGETDSYNGDECMVCNFRKPPQMFMDPDVDVARQIDLRQDKNDIEADADTVSDDGDLVCPNCGSQFNSDDPDGDGINENPVEGEGDEIEGQPGEDEPEDAQHDISGNPEDESGEINDEGERPGQDEDDEPTDDPRKQVQAPDAPGDPYLAEPALVETPQADPANDPYGMQLPDDVPGNDSGMQGDEGPEESDEDRDEQEDEAAEDATAPQEGDICPECGEGILQSTRPSPDDDDDDDAPSPQDQDGSDQDDDDDDTPPWLKSKKGSSRRVGAYGPEEARALQDEELVPEIEATKQGIQDALNTRGPRSGPRFVREHPAYEPWLQHLRNEVSRRRQERKSSTSRRATAMGPGLRMTYAHGRSSIHYAEEGKDRALCGAKVPTNGGITNRKWVDCMKCDSIHEKRYPGVSKASTLSGGPNRLGSGESPSHMSEGVPVAMAQKPRRPQARPTPVRRATPPARKAAATQRPRADLHQVLSQQSRVIRRQQAILSAQSLALQMQARQIARIASLAGLDSEMRSIASQYSTRFTALRKKADEENPAQPIPSPPSEPAPESTDEALQSAGNDDVMSIGASPVNDVSADDVTDVTEPYGTVSDEPLDLNEQDVTAPVDGTEDVRPENETITLTDVQVGDPDDPQTAFPLGGDMAQPASAYATANKSEGRTFASLRLARLRIQAGIAQGDDLALGQSIAADRTLPDAGIAAEIETLAKVLRVRSGGGAQRTAASRRLVPQAASQVGRTTPSMSSGNGPAEPAVRGLSTQALRPSDDEFAFE